MPALRIRREEDLRDIPHNMTPDEAIKKLEEVGWELKRTRNHYIMRSKDNETITLFTTGVLSPWHTQLVYKAWARDSALQKGEEVDQDSEQLPMTVLYRGVLNAVLSRQGLYYRIQDLSNGSRNTVLIKDCKEPSEVELNENGNAPPVVELAKPESVEPEIKEVTEPLPVPDSDPLLNPETIYGRSDFLRVTSRYVEGLKVREEQLFARANEVKSERIKLQALLEGFTGRPTPPVAEKRTVLPPKTEPGKRVFLTSAQWDEILLELKAGGNKPPEIAARWGVDVSTVYNHISLWRKEGRLPSK